MLGVKTCQDGLHKRPHMNLRPSDVVPNTLQFIPRTAPPEHHTDFLLFPILGFYGFRHGEISRSLISVSESQNETHHISHLG